MNEITLIPIVDCYAINSAAANETLKKAVSHTVTDILYVTPFIR